jgi:hypothetical protein
MSLDLERLARLVMRKFKKLLSWSSNPSLWRLHISDAQKLGMSQSAISRIWRAFGLKPHRHETFQISTDPFFIEKVRDIVGLYLSPPTNALVLCVDEKSRIQALNRTQPVLPMRPAQVERYTPEYQRNGTTPLFTALDFATGNVIGQCFRRHRTAEFKRFLDHADAVVPEALEVHLIPDNSMQRIKQPSSDNGCSVIRVTICILHRLTVPGLIRWSAGLRCLVNDRSSAAHIIPFVIWSWPLNNSSLHTMKIPNRLSGQKVPTRSWKVSVDSLRKPSKSKPINFAINQ